MKIDNFEFTFGCDPELFILDTVENKFVCAHGFVPGTKQEPYSLPKGMVQVDGFAAEFGIAPAKTIRGFKNRILETMQTIQTIVDKEGRYKLVPQATVEFDPEIFEKAPQSSKELGCDPDFSAYTEKANPRPDPQGKPVRTGGGHVHIGWTKGQPVVDPEHFKACCLLTKQLDIALLMPSLVWDQDKDRRKLYGAPGAFRPKPYGMEYRSLSNRWLRHPTLIETVYNNTVKAVKDLVDGTFYGRDISQQAILSCVNESDYYTAISWCNRFGIEVPKPPKK